MIIQLKQNITPESKQKIIDKLTQYGFHTELITTQLNQYVIAIKKEDFDLRIIGNMPGVADVHKVDDAYKLVSSKWKENYTNIRISNEVSIGNNEFAIMAGPCSIESEEQIIETIELLKKYNIKIMRGGVFKPRSSPYSFRGLGVEGLKMFARLCHKNSINIITEVMEPDQIDLMYEYVDIFQVGARNSQNFNLLSALGKIDKPVMIKRGISGTIDELLHSAEYVFTGGNEKIILCERGIRTFEKSYRNTFDINAVPLLKEKTHLPVVIDPSHGTGLRHLVSPVALAGILAGADGVIVEIHKHPEKAMSDGKQSLYFHQAESLFLNIRQTLIFRKKILY